MPVYMLFVDRPPYPMTFNFDIDGNEIIDDNDTTINLKLDKSNIFDMGDFTVGDYITVSVSREQLGMEAGETSVSAIVKWAEAYTDYSYKYYPSVPQGDIQSTDLIGPTEDSLQSTLTLTFTDVGDGVYSATIFVCAEDSSADDFIENLIPIMFILEA